MIVAHSGRKEGFEIYCIEDGDGHIAHVGIVAGTLAESGAHGPFNIEGASPTNVFMIDSTNSITEAQEAAQYWRDTFRYFGLLISEMPQQGTRQC